MRHLAVGVALLASSPCAQLLAQTEPSFRTVLGPNFSAVSADGAVVVGNQNGHAIRWTAAGGVERLWPAGEYPSSAFGVSWDGSRIVGWFRERISPPLPGVVRQLAFWWSEATGRVPLPDVPGGVENGSAEWISGNGATIVGEGADGAGYDMCGWTLDGQLQVFGRLPGQSTCSALACSYDGRVVVGLGITGTATQAVVWTATMGLQPLLEPQTSSSVASACNASGDVIVGNDSTSGLGRGWIWTPRNGKRFLAPLGPAEVLPTGISADGRVVVGRLREVAGTISSAFIWDTANGLRLLRSVAQEQLGADVGPLVQATAISADGRTIAGSTSDVPGRSFILRLRAPCAGDVDNGEMGGGRDGQVGPEDLTAFLVWMSEGDLRADLDDGNGTGRPDVSITIDDLLYFLRGYVDGCG